MSNKETSNKKNIIVKIFSVILIIFTLLCVLVVVTNSNKTLIVGIVGLVLLIITMNVADSLKVNKHNSKVISIISIIMDLTSIIFLFKYVIFSYVLVVPAMILSYRCMKADTKNKLTIISFALSLILFVVCLSLSIGGYIKLLKR